jgi:hypothetical protein
LRSVKALREAQARWDAAFADELLERFGRKP